MKKKLIEPRGQLIGHFVSEYKKSPGDVFLPTGLKALDEALGGGIIAGDIVTVGAPSGYGKTSFALTMALNMITAGHTAYMMTFEMSEKDVRDRLIQMVTGISSNRIKAKAFNEEEHELVEQAINYFDELPLIIHYPLDINHENIYDDVKYHIEKFGITVVFVDYLQLIPQNSDNEVQEVDKIMRSLMKVSCDLNLPVIALAQYNKAATIGEKKKPNRNMLRGSASISHNSKTILLLDPHFSDPNTWKSKVPFDVIVDKQRNGPRCTFELMFNPEYARFEDAEV